MATPTQTQPAQGGSSHPFTCNTCQIALRTSELQRTHMQSDWHRYNLKRRVASLPPLTSEIFAEKVLANKASAAATAARASFEKRCEACEKTYYSEGAYVNHLGSQKHRLLAARMHAKFGNETESMADSTFSLGEPLENASTTTGVSTVVEDEEDEKAEEEFEDVVQGLQRTTLESGARDPMVLRPSHPTPESADVLKEHPLSPEGKTPAPAAAPAAFAPGEQEEEEYVHKADTRVCLFCNYGSPTLDLNLNHMNRQHGFFIPERQYLVDLDGLINYLSETIQVLHQCLLCHKTVHTASGVQTHMRDRGHCMIAYDTEEEQMDVGEFFDFRSTYSDAGSDEEEEQEEVAQGGVSLGVKRPIKTTYQNAAGEDIEMGDNNNDEGWESDDSSLSSVPTDEITSVPLEHQEHKFAKLDLHRHHSHTDRRPHKHSDGLFHSHAHHTPTAVYHDEYELHLPSGRTAGHRSLKTYFRQNLRNYPSAEERAEQRMLEADAGEGRHDSDADVSDDGTETDDRPANRGRQVATRANGGLGMVGVSEAKKREVRAVEKRELKRQQRAENRYRAGNERRNNFQKHFRDPLLQ